MQEVGSRVCPGLPFPSVKPVVRLLSLFQIPFIQLSPFKVQQE